ncbi:MAG TPA: two-component regulator propeller domain-containing protein, partial [Cyclobacteriaceae bacterium]|nr:two-component regulator propeller domain-containing protein [Cyclobacteriaceae bacterium]
MNKLHAVIFLVVATCSIVEAQQFTLRQYTAVDGLPQSQVNAIVEDSFGYLWIGTSGGGSARFDGREFKVYTTLDGLLSNIVTSLFIDSKQNIWIVHPRGLTRFDGLVFKKFQQDSRAEGMKRVRRVIEFNDTIFIVSNPGVIGKIHNDSVYYWSKQIIPGKSIYFPHVSKDRQICFYLSDSSFVVPTLKGLMKFSHARVFNKAYNIFNHDNEVWADTDSGSFAIDLQAGTFNKRTKVMTRHIVSYDALQDVYWTRDERTLFREHLVDGKIETDTVIKNVPIMNIHLDAEGNTWFGSAGNGLYRYYALDFDRCGSSKLGPVMAIEKESNGVTWIGANNSLWRMNNGKSTSYPLPYGNDDGVQEIKVSPIGEVWVGSFSGLGKYDAKKDRFQWYTREDGLSSAFVTSLDFDDRGGIWIGTTGGGLNYYDGNKFTPFTDQPL